jgi:hypothetical protein
MQGNEMDTDPNIAFVQFLNKLITINAKAGCLYHNGIETPGMLMGGCRAVNG